MENCVTPLRHPGRRKCAIRNARLSGCATLFLFFALAAQAAFAQDIATQETLTRTTLTQTTLAQTTPMHTDTAQLQLKPTRCVALHQGQVCYQTVQLFWSANQQGNYCLYTQYEDTPVYCWQDAAAGQYQYEFASDGAVELQLHNMQTKTPVATATIDVAWVYKTNTRRKTHWRLF